MLSPKVSPPTPQSSPKKNAQPMLERGASRRIASVSGAVSSASTHGATIQLKTPPASQKLSHAHPFTLR